MAKKKMVVVARGAEDNTYVQHDGKESSMADVRAAVLADIESRVAEPVKIEALNVYVKPSEGKAYYAANGSAGEISGSVDL